MPKKRDVYTTTYISSGSRVISTAMSQVSHTPSTSMHSRNKAGGGGVLEEEDRKPRKEVVGMSYEEYKKEKQGREGEESDLEKIEMIAKELAGEFPLLDLPLILSLLLDYSTPLSIHQNLQEIRDNLTVLEVGMIPDDNHDQYEDADGFHQLQEASRNGSESITTDSRSESGKTSSSAGNNGGKVKREKKGQDKEVIARDMISPAPSASTSSSADALSPSSTPLSPSVVSTPPIDGKVHGEEEGDKTLLPTDRFYSLNLRDQDKQYEANSKERESAEVGMGRRIERRESRVYEWEREKRGAGVDVVGEDEGNDVDEEGGETEGGETEGELDPVIFLTEMFPTLENLIITHTLSDNDNDLSLTIESLMSIERIRDVQERGTWRDEGGETTDEEIGTGTGTDEGGSDLEVKERRTGWKGWKEDIDALEEEKQRRKQQETVEDQKERKRKGDEERKKDWSGYGGDETKGGSGPQSDAQPKKRKNKNKVQALDSLSTTDLGVTPKPLPLTTPLYGKIHGHYKQTERQREESEGSASSGPRVREVSAPVTKGPSYSSKAGRFAALGIEGGSGGLTDSDNESVGSATSSVGVGARKNRRSVEMNRSVLASGSAFPPIAGSRVSKNQGDRMGGIRGAKPPGPSIVIDESERGKIESMASWLADLVPTAKASEAYFRMHMLNPLMDSPGAGLETALKHLQVPEMTVVEAIQQVQVLVIESEENKEDCTLCVRAANGDVSVALDLLQSLKSARSWPGFQAVRAERTETPMSSPGIPSTGRMFPPEPHKVAKPRKKDQHPQNWKTVSKAPKPKAGSDHPLRDFIPAYSRGHTPQDLTPGSLYNPTPTSANDTLLYDLQSCHVNAAEQRMRREDAMRLAGQYFKNGMRGGGGGRGREVASFYAAEARRLEAEAMLWELRAARQIVERQSAVQDRWVIDVHHLTLAEASVVVREKVNDWHQAQGYAPLPSRSFRVITGVGKHSASHVAVLRPALANMLEREGWKVDKAHRSDGYVIVRGVKGA